MKQLLIISGKGGTGKTTLTASFAALAGNLVLADCDVDAADLHLLLHPQIQATHNFVAGHRVEIDQTKCQQCLQCEKLCRFQAIHHTMDPVFWSVNIEINPILCEGCTLCRYICPSGAIAMKSNICGQWFHSTTSFGTMIHASLGIGEENSGKLVTKVLTEARKCAVEGGHSILLVDGPPGIGCPVISSFSGTDLVLIVTEPTIAGIHDLKRVLELVQHFQIKALVCINKAGLDTEMEQQIITYCQKENIEFVGKIPFDRTIPESISFGKIPVKSKQSISTKPILDVYNRVMDILNKMEESDHGKITIA